MTPSNPDNQQSLIYRIADALGVFHLVAPVNHTHSQAEIDGLATALAGKANAVPAGSPSGGIIVASTSGELFRSDKTIQNILDEIAAKAPLSHSHDSIGQGENNSVSVSEGSLSIELNDGETGGEVTIPVSKLDNLQRAINNPDSTPTASSNNLVTSGGVKAAIDALFTNKVPIHQLVAILPKTSGHSTDYEAQSWLGDGKMALVLQTARPITVSIEAIGYDDSPDGTWSGSSDISFDLAQGVRTVKNIYDLMSAQLQNDYPGEYVGVITDWKIFVEAKNTVPADTVCLINFYNPTSAE